MLWTNLILWLQSKIVLVWSVLKWDYCIQVLCKPQAESCKGSILVIGCLDRCKCDRLFTGTKVNSDKVKS